MKILLVEDDILLAQAVVELLSANNYTIDLANNGQTGLDLALSWYAPRSNILALELSRVKSQESKLAFDPRLLTFDNLSAKYTI
ncbi:two component transcriptional regulator, winged helix family protein [Nostoc carneum NIES-2107]|nr:two component transcriptional regulator, winged helix family protein [Nostoc carneum NIES-2107]